MAAAVNAQDVWGVGYIGDQTLIEQWNSSGWAVVPPLNSGPITGVLGDIAIGDAQHAWAVGYIGPASAEQMLILQGSS